ncbi:ferredoxin-type protein NapF [Billgrantia sp. Q4P2]|uniref:ferredoxin-type protein NapF n=1 Tax=Billgrantia sp. Q4P2 TaxID=3463857 RepID=UPI00405772B4
MSPVDPSRRALLQGRVWHEPVIRPPWSAHEGAFTQLCTRCSECIKACETQVIVPGDGGFPEIDFSLGECTFCQACVHACPEPVFANSEAVPAWNNVATIEESCLGIHGTYCKNCGEVCEISAIRFTFNAHRVPEPCVDSEACNGCGACVQFCPVQAVKVMPKALAGLGNEGERHG